jgi:hypothetical protein
MESILEVDEQFPPDAILYRTIDFFAAADIIHNQRLMFSRADTFHDRNEGVDRLLAQLEMIRANDCFGFGWTDRESAQRHHDLFKRSHYISCWTKTAESVAMWSLYSPDLASVRISTKVGKLIEVAKNFLNKRSLASLGEQDIGKQVVASAEARIAAVIYKPLSDISRRISSVPTLFE